MAIAISVAFGRLCVETMLLAFFSPKDLSVAFGRLCVETTPLISVLEMDFRSPSGGCVLKHFDNTKGKAYPSSVAFGRLCVETIGAKT